MLHAVLKMFWGPLDNDENKELADVGKRELTTLLPLVALVFVLGFFPNLFLEKMNPSIDAFLRDYDAKLIDSNKNDTVHILSSLGRGTAPFDKVAVDKPAGSKLALGSGRSAPTGDVR
jgi:formate hydrogenlyase subunit 3/multisubunit Na+/H+ antiporter MnhD subunit